MRSPGLWLGAMVAVVAMGFVGLVNLGGVASGSTIMKPNGSESMTSSASGDTVWICHREGAKIELKEIELSALDGHLGHDDFYPKDGVCLESSESATATETSTATATATPTVTVTATVPGPVVTAIVPGPGATSVVTSTATATVTASPSITPAPGVVEATPAITPAPGVVEQSPTIAPLPATVPAGGGGEAPGGLPLWALLVIAAAGVTGIGASVRLAQRTTR